MKVDVESGEDRHYFVKFISVIIHSIMTKMTDSIKATFVYFHLKITRLTNA